MWVSAHLRDCCFFFTGFIYKRQPVCTERSRPLRGDDLEELILETLRHFAATAAADRDTVDRPDRGDLGRGAGEENFIGEVEGGALNRSFKNFDTHLAGDL